MLMSDCYTPVIKCFIHINLLIKHLCKHILIIILIRILQYISHFPYKETEKECLGDLVAVTVMSYSWASNLAGRLESMACCGR